MSLFIHMSTLIIWQTLLFQSATSLYINSYEYHMNLYHLWWIMICIVKSIAVIRSFIRWYYSLTVWCGDFISIVILLSFICASIWCHLSSFIHSSYDTIHQLLFHHSSSYYHSFASSYYQIIHISMNQIN